MRFQFGEFVVDDDARQLTHDDAVVHLSAKAFDLLVTLIRERPRALSKADLQNRLWPKTFVSDASLAMIVAQVRAALGESARQPHFVRTVHRHGYAFQGSALEMPQTPPVTPTGKAVPAPAADPAAIGFWLIASSQQILLVRGDNIIGRDPKACIWLDSPSVSRRHACIRVEDDGVTLEDLGSKNGTRARGARVTTVTPLENGDDLRFGSVRVTFRAWASDPTRSEAGPS